MKGLCLNKDEPASEDEYDEELSLSPGAGASRIMNGKVPARYDVSFENCQRGWVRFASTFGSQDHEMTVVEIHGITTPRRTRTAQMLYITLSLRDIQSWFATKNDGQHFAMMQKFDEQACWMSFGTHLHNMNATSYDVHNKTAALPTQNYVDSIGNFLDDFYVCNRTRKKRYYGEPESCDYR
ncbi:AKR_collapsed_G0005680.mRNA.1.CDS.1 [Saccharomyces cerevisiae]|nr:AKR_collapsed_G0005680.mRNA.1.CDS.1 [Saccharomyces cerevisiae]